MTAKPKFLYHASSRNNLKVIEPRATTLPSGFKKGPVVFATHNFTCATQFLVPHDDTWANGGAFGGDFFFIISDERRFEKKDKGGSVYLVSSKGFEKYNRREWYRKKSVKTISSVSFKSGLEAMIIQGVQVYFVDRNKYEKYQNDPEKSFMMLNKLVSENEKWGLPTIKFDLYRGSKKKVN